MSCAARPVPDSSEIPIFQEIPVAPTLLAYAAQQAVQNSAYGLELDPRYSSANSVLTHHKPLTVKNLKKLAYPGSSGLRGKPIHADLHVVLSIRPSYVNPNYSRITIQPVFMVYISRWRDRRQWIQWQSNGKLEEELIALIGTYLEDPNL